jgi:hypothetical protein
LKHIHRLRPHWILVTSPVDYEGFYRVVLWATCLECGLQGAFAAEQSTLHAAGRLLEPGQ